MATTRPKTRNDLVFAINGEKYSLAPETVNPTMTLNEFIRSVAGLKGTKLSCGEGGCGACAVVLTRYDARLNTLVYRSTNSCLRLLPSIHGWAVTTIEGLGTQAKGYHPLQERLVAFNGSQCGYCTPGMIMTMYGGVKANNGKGGANLRPEQVESWFDGNICRCTGYRPILDAFKSFVPDSGVKDYFNNTATGPYDEAKDPAFPEFLKSPVAPLYIPPSEHNQVSWYRPTRLGDVFPILAKFPRESVRLVAGNTGSGIYKNHHPTVFIDVQGLPELTQISGSSTRLLVGSSVPLTDLHAALITHAHHLKEEQRESTLALAQHVLRVANVHVRNTGTVGGNLILAKTEGFLSDLATGLVAASATAVLASSKGVREISVEEFLSKPKFEEGEVLVAVSIPNVKEKELLRLYKAALRPVNSHAFVNGGFRLRVGPDMKIVEAVAVFGGILEDKAGAHPVRATKLEQHLIGRPLAQNTLQDALAVLKEEIVPAGHHIQSYRHRLVTGFFYKFFLSALRSVGVHLGQYESGLVSLSTTFPVSSGSQAFPAIPEHTPVHAPVNKIEGALQASGEARYTDDIPDVAGTLYAAYVHANFAHAEILDVDISEAAKVPGFVRYVTASDIPGKNLYGAFGINSTIFPEGEVLYHGQPVGVVVATSLHAARKAATKVQVKLNPLPLLLSLEEGLKDREKNKVTPVVNKIECGDVQAAIKEAGKNIGKGSVPFDTQKHFYMEMQTAYVVPDEDGVLTVHCSVQGQSYVAETISNLLNIPINKIRAIHRRSGGAFGGKMTHAMLHCSVAALCSFLTKRPVRVLLTRNEDMRMTGGRENVSSDYTVAFTDEGKITGLHCEYVMNVGWSIDLSGWVPFLANRSMQEAYKIPNFYAGGALMQSNVCTRTAVRGPGEILASVIMETAIAQISYATGLSEEEIRERNFYPPDDTEKKATMGFPLAIYTVPELWQRCKEKSEFGKRSAQVEAFNKANRWKKRGIAMTTVNYAVGVMPKTSLVNIFKDGTVIVWHTGTEMGQGLNTKAAQGAAYVLGQVLGTPLPLSLIRFGDSDSFAQPNATGTGGSTGSEGVVAAVLRAAEGLVPRLKAVLQKLQEQAAKDGKSEPITWEKLVEKAVTDNVNLSFQASYGEEAAERLNYNIYGVAASEVEIDVLTGELQVLRSDMVYDCAKSLNPAVDIGQAEGAFVFGLGHLFRERELLDETTGELISDGTWEYKPPSARDIPFQFNVEFIENPLFDKGVLGSKASGEPPLVLSVSAYAAVRKAIQAARADYANFEFVHLPVPATPDVIQSACKVNEHSLNLP